MGAASAAPLAPRPLTARAGLISAVQAVILVVAHQGLQDALALVTPHHAGRAGGCGTHSSCQEGRAVPGGHGRCCGSLTCGEVPQSVRFPPSQRELGSGKAKKTSHVPPRAGLSPPRSISRAHLPQTSSSEESPQSSTPLHFHSAVMHTLFLHCHCPGRQGCRGQPCSSQPSSQSWCRSHSSQCGMQW